MRRSVMMWCAATVMAISASGCKNAIYFYESEKFGMSVEAKIADAAAPLTGTIGFKQRVVAVVPSRELEETGEEKSVRKGDAAVAAGDQAVTAGARRGDVGADAMALIGFFDLKKKRTVVEGEHPITVKLALLSGRAATCLSPDQARRAYQVFGGLAATQRISILADISRLRDNLNALAKEKDDAEAARHAKMLEVVAESSLAFCQAFVRYGWNEASGTLHRVRVESLRGETGEDGEAVSATDRLVEFAGKLNTSLEELEKWDAARQAAGDGFEFQMKRGDTEAEKASAVDADDARTHLERMNGMVERIGRALARDGVIHRAAQYYNSQVFSPGP